MFEDFPLEAFWKELRIKVHETRSNDFFLHVEGIVWAGCSLVEFLELEFGFDLQQVELPLSGSLASL